MFAVDEETGRLSVLGVLDRETQDAYNLIATVHDGLHVSTNLHYFWPYG